MSRIDEDTFGCGGCRCYEDMDSIKGLCTHSAYQDGKPVKFYKNGELLFKRGVIVDRTDSPCALYKPQRKNFLLPKLKEKNIAEVPQCLME